ISDEFMGTVQGGRPPPSAGAATPAWILRSRIIYGVPGPRRRATAPRRTEENPRPARSVVVGDAVDAAAVPSLRKRRAPGSMRARCRPATPPKGAETTVTAGGSTTTTAYEGEYTLCSDSRRWSSPWVQPVYSPRAAGLPARRTGPARCG